MTSSAMQQLYQQIILDHAKSAHGAVADLGELDALVPGAPAGLATPPGLRQAQSHQVNTTGSTSSPGAAPAAPSRWRRPRC
jgi:nitrogen fixation NifU-like protein